MQRLALGVLVGTAAWFGSLGVAEAQPIPIPPVGPTSVFAGATELDCTCGVQASQGFWSRAFGWYNGQGVETNSPSTYYVATTTSVDDVIPTFNWPMLAGDFIAVQVQFAWRLSYFPRSSATGNVSIVQGTSMIPLRKWGLEVEAVDRDRREWA